MTATASNSRERRPAIAQVVETLDTGGAEHLAIKFANVLARHGYNSHLYVTSHDGPMGAAISEAVKVRIFGYRRASITNPVKFAFSINDGFSRFCTAIKTDGIQLIQTHLPTPNFWGLALQKRNVCQSVATIHNNKEFSYGSHNSFRGRLRRRAYREIVTSCAATIAVSDQVRESFLQEIGIPEARAGRLISVPNGIDLPTPRDPVVATQLQKNLGIPTDSMVCVAIGRVCEQKNFQDLIPVAEILQQMGVPILLLIAGDGPDLSSLRQRIVNASLTNMIKTLGNVTNVPELLAAADIFVMPSLWEGLPLALLEAMGAHLPVVGNAIGGLQDVVSEGKTGFLVPPGDHQAMATRIAELAKNLQLRTEMGNRGHDLVAEKYNLDRVIDSLDVLYRKILG